MAEIILVMLIHPVLQPIPASSHIICTASLDSIEGRKTWVRAAVRDRPDGIEYAAGKALFVIPKKHPLDRATDNAQEQDRAQAAGQSSVFCAHDMHTAMQGLGQLTQLSLSAGSIKPLNKCVLSAPGFLHAYMCMRNQLGLSNPVAFHAAIAEQCMMSGSLR